MLAVIGSASSSGSTFFSNLIDRHPAVACGEELKFLAQPMLYDDFAGFRRRRRWFRRFGLPGHPFHPRREVFTNLEGYNLTPAQVWGWVGESQSLPEFVERFRKHVATLTGKPVWAEKTLLSIRVASKILAAIPGAKIIHLVRDPRDQAASVAHKRKTPKISQRSVIWLAAVAAAQTLQGRPDYLEIRYEDICSQPEPTLESLCRFLGIEFDMRHFAEDSPGRSCLRKWEGVAVWASRPGGGISTKSIGRHRSVAADWTYLDRIRLTREYADLLGTKQWTAGELARLRGYDLGEPTAVPETGYRPLRTHTFWFGWFYRMLGVPRAVVPVEISGEEV